MLLSRRGLARRGVQGVGGEERISLWKAKTRMVGMGELVFWRVGGFVFVDDFERLGFPIA